MYLSKLAFQYSSAKYLEMQQLEHMGILFLIFDESLYCFPQGMYQFMFPLKVYEGVFFPYPLPHLLFFAFLIIVIFKIFIQLFIHQLEANYFTILQWFLSYIDMNQPQIYMYSPSRSPLPPPSPPDPSGSSQCTRSEHLSHASNLGW